MISVIFTGCNILLYSNIQPPELIIKSNKLSETKIEINADLRNNSLSSIALLNIPKDSVNYRCRPNPYWQLKIFLNDSIQLETKNEILFKQKLPEKTDCSIIKSNEIVKFSFRLDVEELVRVEELLNRKNDSFQSRGECTFQLFYQDSFKKHGLAVGSVGSNEVELAL